MEIYVFSGHEIHTIVEETVKDSLIPITVKVRDVEVKTIYILKQGKKTVSKPKDTDHVQHYGHTVLQVGLLYMEFWDVIYRPDRDRLLDCLKYMMLMFKSHNSRSKYAFEILRLVCHQQASYSLRSAYQSIYGLFVKIRGKKDSHIPADLAMEHLVKRTKKMLKGLGPMNKDKNLLARSKAVAAMDNIADNFDSISDVKVRAGYHKERNSHTDELKMIYDLREVKPFVTHSGRFFSAHKNIMSPADSVNGLEFESWIDYHKVRLEFESGM
ncbi:hypothetical protein ACJMK2_002109 [Sinanodonta woodiana]|uniref:DUF6589 domain-containing protein n=1 Tax=Sinanodonta woodiana TaxID=1069815 RepID=A0ABD3XVX3_SINWO